MTSIDIPIFSEKILEIRPTHPEIAILEQHLAAGKMTLTNAGAPLGIPDKYLSQLARPYEILNYLNLPPQSHEFTRMPLLFINPKIAGKPQIKDRYPQEFTTLLKNNGVNDEVVINALLENRMQALINLNETLKESPLQGIDAMTEILKTPIIPFRFALYGIVDSKMVIDYLRGKDELTKLIWNQAREKNIWTGIWQKDPKDALADSQIVKQVVDAYTQRKPLFHIEGLNSKEFSLEG
jgi:hypothetical protein